MSISTQTELSTRLVRIIIATLVFSVTFLFINSTQADTTSILRPNADGTDDSASWTNTTGAACNTVNCYTEVIETSGASCTNSDGDTSYIKASANGANQTFDLNLSSIPDNSTITQVDITVCQKRVGTAPGNKFQTRRCVNGACTNSGADLGASGAYTENSQSHTGLNITKTSATDFEIGIAVTDTNNKVVRISQISAVVTYTLPPTPTSGEAPPVVVSGGGTGLALIIFSGKAFPGATLGVYLMGAEYGQVLIDKEFKTENDGSFKKEINDPVEEQRLYGLFIKDRDGKPAKSKFFTYTAKLGTTLHQENIIFAPTIKVNKSAFVRNEFLLVSGDAAPGNTVEALADGKVIGNARTDDAGLYKIFVSTNDLVLKIYNIQTRQVDSVSGKTSDISETRTIKVGSFSFSNIDFNQDGQINISDWSIFLSNWASADPKVKIRADLNGDGKVDVSDFSIFLVSFQLSQGH